MHPRPYPWPPLCLALLAACGGGDEPPAPALETARPAETVELPEGLEGFEFLRGHNTADQDTPDWSGRREGARTLWYPNGIKEGEGHYDDDHLRTGPWTFWHDNGHKRWEGTYRAGEVVGLERSYFEDGTPKYEGAYVDGKRDGPWREWRRGGRLLWEGRFVAGKRHGVYRAWSSDGSLDQQESGLYEHGRKVGSIAESTVHPADS